ncbi:antibiotic biosynthesis monooxygenase [Streptosporangium sp. NBC_01755]|uniref:antibiotic biosynthesis monooxygenase family protein n=1 Tax=unclassified Streptosporangium TaxID=2632669 RepID=UPI002DDB8231|nr:MULTISPECIES: antibiotic biosynthesis monooxygenase [unclassified Streptosporangium]WSA26542.1 antibiotic biosynthesis monooxygenase [Streptosporangium sp. NBC_01810]WSD02035.1 antibiotic biosynthesis monooxygenase [Streptosporangium sp. NBC_01755]
MPSVVKINVLTVSAEMREELERRFSGRAGVVESADGFEWFELLRPVDGTDRYLVYTRWRSEEDFKRWTESQAFQRGHAQAAAEAGQGHGHAHSAAQGHGHGQDQGGPAQGHGHGQGPAASGAELWSFEVVQSTGPAPGA